MSYSSYSSNADTEETIESSLNLDAFTNAYMQLGFQKEEATELAMFDLRADMYIQERGFLVDLDKLNRVM